MTTIHAEQSKLKRRVRSNLLQNAWIEHTALHTAFKLKTFFSQFPKTPNALRDSKLFKAWWYYSVELLPDVFTTGNYSSSFPLLPRILLRNCQIDGSDCLDIGAMEGLMAVLMKRQGARRVLATDGTYHCYQKLKAVQHYYNAPFQFSATGLAYDLAKKLKHKAASGFDLINLSGVLYHVYSPMHVLAGVRPLLKPDGLIIVSTNVVRDDSYSMAFNHAGRIEKEQNTFWYPSVPMLEYMLRYFRLDPVDCLFYPYQSDIGEMGYISIVCRATENGQSPDSWANHSLLNSWESIGLCDFSNFPAYSRSTIGYSASRNESGETTSLAQMINEQTLIGDAASAGDTNILSLNDSI